MIRMLIERLQHTLRTMRVVWRLEEIKNILGTLINASEKAACVARSCCEGSQNEVLLVAEKLDGEANTRFDHDFKTIADVLAQEAARSEIISSFPELREHVRGEECSEIAGVRIVMQRNAEDTAVVLRALVVPTVAIRMGKAAHSKISHGFCDNLPEYEEVIEIDTADLGVWIDPIDATAEFIAGVHGETNPDRGLQCVTVLIGAYLRSTGEPIVGVINQPFFNNGKGRVVWGINYRGTQEWARSDTFEGAVQNNKVILMSSAEKPDLIEKFKNAGWEVKTVPGAGHKLLKVVLGEAAAYIVSQGTTFRWDTCGPHSILRAKGGDIINYITHTPLSYTDSRNINPQQYCHSEGIIAYSDASVLEQIKRVLSE